MTPAAVIATLTGYIALLFVVAWISGRRTDNAGFFTANRRTPWYLAAFAMVGAAMSGVTFISVPGSVAADSFSYMQMVAGFTVGQLIVAYLLVPTFYRLRLVSLYEYLDDRFGARTHAAGAWCFFVAKMLGTALQVYVVCTVMQLLVFDRYGLPFWLNAAVTMALVWLYTRQGGVRSLIRTDILKTCCLIASLVLSILFITRALGLSFGEMAREVAASPHSRILFLDDPASDRYFWKMFVAGIVTLVAMTGLGQDMMQRNLSCKNFKDSQKNMITSVISQFFVILLFLMLGVLLYIFAANQQIAVEKSDELFPLIATGNYFPAIVGILFIIGLISSAYSAAGSALTALTTSFTVDILGTKGKSEETVVKMRKKVHIGMAVVMGITIFVFNLLNNTSVIDAVYILASYTYGPILGLFAFGIFMKQQVRDKYIPLVAIASPVLCFILQKNSEAWFGGYQFSYELLIFNALFTFIGLCLLIKKDKKNN